MKTMLALLILGSSSVALARPITQDDYRDTYRDHRDDDSYRDHRDDDDAVIVRDHRDDQIVPAPVQQYQLRPIDEARWMRFRNRPITLANDVSLMRQRNRDHRPLRIDIDSRIALRKLRLDREQGRAYIDSLVVTFSDGHQQTVELHQMLSARSPSLTIDLDHRGATGVDIYGMTERGRAMFDVIGLRR